MSTLTTTRNYSANNILTESQLDSAFDSIETFLNTTKLNADNIQTSAITAALLASNAVTSVKINSSAVTTAKINDLAVTTAKIAANAVTYAKRVALNSTLSSTSGEQNITSGTFVAITNATAAITTSGRPTMVCLQGTEGENSLFQVSEAGSGDTSVSARIRFFRDAVEMITFPIRVDYPTDTAASTLMQVPANTFWFVDPDTGTSAKTYTASAVLDNGDNLLVSQVKLFVYEL